MPDAEGDVIETLSFAVWCISDEISKYIQALGDYSQDAADKLERGFDSYANTIRQNMRSNRWVPDSIKPPPPRSPPPSKIQPGMVDQCTDWVDRNRALSAAVVGFVGTSLFLIYRHRNRSRRKRRAHRARSGAKTEVVVLAGSPYARTTKSIALDLEKRGFLIYIPVGSLEEETAVAELRMTNIHCLNFDITSAESTSEVIEKLSNILCHPHRHGTDRLHLASLVVVENYPNTLDPAPTHTISSSSWSDALNSRVLYPISITQLFLPLLVSESASEAMSEPTTIVVITPSNISSINAPHHARESVTTAALSSYFSTLRAELPISIKLTHIRLGSLKLQSAPSSKLDMALARVRRFASPSSSTTNSTLSSRSSPNLEQENIHVQSPETRKLHHGVFDAIVGRTRGTVFLGRGALLYALFGTIVPSNLVGWMMRYHRSDLNVGQQHSATKQSSTSSSQSWEDVRQG